MDIRYIYNTSAGNELIRLFETDYVQKESLKVINVHEGVIMPNGFKIPVGVYDDNGLFVDLSAERGIICEKIIIQNIEYRNEVVLYLGEIHTGHWGNFFIDNISRLWYFIQSNKKIKIAYCGRNFKEGTFGNASNNAFHLLSLFGISRDDFIDVRKPMQFNQVIVPQKSFIHHEYVTSEYLIIFNKIIRLANKVYTKVYDKIYFTRRQLSKKKEIGESIFEKLFEKNGYKIIAPEKLTIEEQAYLVYNCKMLASLEGTLAHNVVFAKKDTLQIILRKQSEIIPRQIMLNQITSTRVIYIDVYNELFKGFPISHDRGPFLLMWNENIDRFITDFGYESISVGTASYLKNLFIYCIKCFFFIFKHKVKNICTKFFLW